MEQMKNIGQQSMICSIEFGLPRQARQLKMEADAIEKKAKAEKGTVRPPSMSYFRRMPDPEKGEKGKREIDGLQELKDLQADYKKAVRMLARYPYAGEFYLAPAPVVEDLLKVREKYETGKQALIHDVWMHWADAIYPEWAESAPVRMGTMYDPDDFPTLGQCKKKFRMRLTILPLAEKEQVARITLISKSSQEMLMKHADATQKEAIMELRKQIWKDFMTPLQQVVTVFKKDKPIIYETLLGNLMQIANVVPSYKDLFNDPNLEKAVEEVKEVFGQMTTNDLRKSDENRKLAFASATKLIAKFDPFAREFIGDDDDKE